METVGKQLFSGISKYQKEIHNIHKEASTCVDYFTRDGKIIFPWNNLFYKELGGTAGTGFYTYSIHNEEKYLSSIHLTCSFPSFRLKKEYRGNTQFCYKFNPGNVPVIKAIFMIDKKEISQIDRSILDVTPQFYRREDSNSDFQEFLGNEEKYLEWTNYLPPLQTSVRQPWMIDQEPLPIHIFNLCSSTKNVDITITYYYNSKLSNMLRMRVRKDENSQWEELQPGSIDMTRFEGSYDSNSIIDVPKLWAGYIYCDESFLSYKLKCDYAPKSGTKYVDIVIPYYTFKHINSPQVWNKEKPNPSFTFNPKSEVKSVLFFLENRTAKDKHNNPSNFTNDPEYIMAGERVLKRIKSFKIDGIDFIQDMNAAILKSTYGSHFPKRPLVPGVHGFITNIDVSDDHINSASVYMKECDFECELDDTGDCDYIFHVIYKHLSKMTIRITYKGDEDKKIPESVQLVQ